MTHRAVGSVIYESLGDQRGSLSKAAEYVGNTKKELCLLHENEPCLLPTGSRTSPMKATNTLPQTPQGDDQKCHRAL